MLDQLKWILLSLIGLVWLGLVVEIIWLSDGLIGMGVLGFLMFVTAMLGLCAWGIWTIWSVANA